MINFSKEEKCAMIIAITHIGCSNKSKGIARTKVMLRYQDMLGIDTFDTLEYANTKNDDVLPTLQAMSNEKKKYYLQMMVALLRVGGSVNESELDSFWNLVAGCRIPANIVEEVLNKSLRNN